MIWNSVLTTGFAKLAATVHAAVFDLAPRAIGHEDGLIGGLGGPPFTWDCCEEVSAHVEDQQ